MQNVGPGYSWELVAKNTALTSDALAAEFKVYDATNAPADAVVDVELKGPKSDAAA